MSDVNTSIVNNQFVEDVSAGPGSEEYTKTAAQMNAFLLDKMREKCFCDRIIPVQPISASHPQMQRSRFHDTLVFLDHIEPDSQATAITYRGQPDVEWVKGPRYEIAPELIASKEYVKTVQELRAYPYPILRVVEDNIVVDMQGIKDYYFLTFVTSAVNQGAVLSAATGQYTAGRKLRGEQAVAAFVTAGNAFDNAEGEVQRNDLIDLGGIFSNSKRPKGCLLMNLGDWDKVAKWTIEDLGDEKQGSIAFDGLKESRIGAGAEGIKVITTIKNELVLRGDIYMFTPPEYLGRNFVLEEISFWAKKERNKIQFGAQGEHMTGIGNIASIAKLELYNRSAAKALPAESAMGGGVYNQAEAGLTYPVVNSY